MIHCLGSSGVWVDSTCIYQYTQLGMQRCQMNIVMFTSVDFSETVQFILDCGIGRVWADFRSGYIKTWCLHVNNVELHLYSTSWNLTGTGNISWKKIVSDGNHISNLYCWRKYVTFNNYNIKFSTFVVFLCCVCVCLSYFVCDNLYGKWKLKYRMFYDAVQIYGDKSNVISILLVQEISLKCIAQLFSGDSVLKQYGILLMRGD